MSSVTRLSASPATTALMPPARASLRPLPAGTIGIARRTHNGFPASHAVRGSIENRDFLDKPRCRADAPRRNVPTRPAHAATTEERVGAAPRVLVFGASGLTGQATVRDLLASGHRVTAFVRSASKLDIAHARLAVVQGDICHAEDVYSAIPGHDAVILTVGARPGNFSDVASRGTRSVVDAMEAAGVKRLICVTSYGLGDTFERLNWLEKCMYNFAMKDQLADKAVQEEIVQKSSLNWTLLRPRMLNNNVPKLDRKHSRRDPLALYASPQGETRGSSVSRFAVALFAVRALTNEDAYGQAYALSQK